MSSTAYTFNVIFVVWLSVVSCCHAQEQSFAKTEADRTFGINQVKQVGLDLGLSEKFATHPKVVQWMENCFSGAFIGERIYWIDKPPVISTLGEYQPSQGGYPTIIRVSKDPALSDYDRFAILIFELHNSKRLRQGWSIFHRAVAGELSAEDYATQVLEMEHAALVECKRFLIEHSLPPNGNRYLQENLAVDVDFKKFLLEKRDAGMFKVYVRFYEESIVPQQKINGANK